MENLIGRTLNRYQVVSLLGEGGMGAVLKGYDITLQRDVAIKVMHSHFVRQSNMRERFLQEARTAARMNHPSIVKIYDFGQEGDVLYIVMEFIPGSNLRELLDGLIAKRKWLLLNESLILIAQLASAVDYAHHHGVLHRDIKPANVMIVPEPTRGLPYRPVLTDLGLAKLVEGQPLTQEGISMGTPAYMSPEQALGQKVDERSDVYSLGIMLFELAVGYPPFPAKTISEAIRYHTKERPPAPRSIRADIPIRIENVILKALEKDPANRHKNAEEFAQAVEGLQKEATSAASVQSMSLLTEFQQSIEQRGKSILDDFAKVASGVEDQLQILEQNQPSRMLKISSRQLTIGRGKQNDLAIEDTKLSRQHARIEFDGKDYFIIDLQSTNGTFLENTRLLPGVPEIWPAQKTLRLGNTWLHLVRAKQVEVEPKTDKLQTSVDLIEKVQKPIGKRLTATLDVTLLSVEAGGSADLKVQMLNQGQLVDHFNLDVTGIPSAWVSLPQKGVQLMPGEQQTLGISFHPPKTPESKAETYPIQVQILSQTAPDDITKVSAALTVLPYYQFDLSIRPQRLRSIKEADFTLQVRNQCNTSLSFDFEARDPEDSCSFVFKPAFLAVHAGQESSCTLHLQPRRFFAVDVARMLTFTITARSREKIDLTRQVFGEWEQIPLLLDLTLSPASQQGSACGVFSLILKNKTTTDLSLQLEGADVMQRCQFHFEPRSIVLPAMKEISTRLTVTSNQALSGAQPVKHTFTVYAKLVESPDSEQKTQGEWIQIAPSFDIELRTDQPEAEMEGIYTLTTRNNSDCQLIFQPAAVGQTQDCTYEFRPVSLNLLAQQSGTTQLIVRAKSKLTGDVNKLHSFQVVVNPQGSAGLEKRLDAEWTQLPSRKAGSLFWCWFLIFLGWGLATFFGGGILFSLSSLGGGMMEYLIASLLGGCLTGAIGGLFTGLGLKAAESEIKFKHILRLMIIWSILWSMANLVGLLGYM